MTSPWNAYALHGEEFLFFKRKEKREKRKVKRKGRIKIFLRSREEILLGKAFPCAGGA